MNEMELILKFYKQALADANEELLIYKAKLSLLEQQKKKEKEEK